MHAFDTLKRYTNAHTIGSRPTVQLKMSSVFGTGQSANFTRDQFTSTISVPQDFDKYIHKLL